jgi:transcriptional regulator with XRE-family HTH domain
MSQEFVELGSRLKREREGRALGLADVARVTKIPERSLLRLEEGRFEELPGDVFVRGFLRSYARCVGLDAEELVRQYGELSTRPLRSASALASATPIPSQRIDEDRQEVSETAVPEGPHGGSRVGPTKTLNLLARALFEASRGTQRLSLTVAVIVLVIVATLTLSLLLRRPGHPGPGLSMAVVGDTRH